MVKTEERLGAEAKFFLPFLDSFSVYAGKRNWRYLFLEEQFHAELASKDLSAGVQFYWLEILYRAHMSAAVSLLRSHRWLRGAVYALETNNVLAFAACWRGFMEGAADSWDGLGRVPEALAKNHAQIQLAITKQPGPLLIVDGLEETLIHFLAARKIRAKEPAPDSHRAKQAKEYFDAFQNETEAIYNFYKDLCELTHSSMASVDVFLRLSPEGDYILDVSREPDIIEDLLTKHRSTIPTLFFTGVNPSVCILKVINEFPVENLHSPGLERLRLDGIKMGGRIKDLLGKKEW